MRIELTEALHRLYYALNLNVEDIEHDEWCGYLQFTITPTGREAYFYDDGLRCGCIAANTCELLDPKSVLT